MTDVIGISVQLSGVLVLAMTFISEHLASRISRRTQLWVDRVRHGASFKYIQYSVAIVAWYAMATVGYTGAILNMGTPVREAALQAAIDALIAFPVAVFGLAVLLASLSFPLSVDDVAAHEWWRTHAGRRRIVALFSGLFVGLIGVVWICYLMVLPIASLGPSLVAVREIGLYEAVWPLIFSVINLAFMSVLAMLTGPGRHLGRRERFRRALVQVWHFVAPTTGQVITLPFFSLCGFTTATFQRAVLCIQKRTNLVRASGVGTIIIGLGLEIFASLTS